MKSLMLKLLPFAFVATNAIAELVVVPAVPVVPVTTWVPVYPVIPVYPVYPVYPNQPRPKPTRHDITPEWIDAPGFGRVIPIQRPGKFGPQVGKRPQAPRISHFEVIVGPASFSDRLCVPRTYNEAKVNEAKLEVEDNNFTGVIGSDAERPTELVDSYPQRMEDGRIWKAFQFAVNGGVSTKATAIRVYMTAETPNAKCGYVVTTTDMGGPQPAVDPREVLPAAQAAPMAAPAVPSKDEPARKAGRRNPVSEDELPTPPQEKVEESK